MKLSTEIDFPKLPHRLGYTDAAVLLGSCFSEHIGTWLDGLKFNASSNPTGIIYNPVSIAKHITHALGDIHLHDSDFFDNEGQSVHCDFHSSLNGVNQSQTLLQIEDAVSRLKKDLLAAKMLFVTFGTSIVFERKDNGQVVNNCHKLPAANFQKRTLSELEMADSMRNALQMLRAFNPEVQLVLTVSPIRHLRHGAVENQRSKARLIRLCEMLGEGDQNCIYLPIYEYVMDELRDYRFYRHDDMIHLNELGLEMIREKIREHVISPDALHLMSRVEKWKQMSAHRVMQSETPSAIKFLKKLQAETEALSQILPDRFS
jgi:hypothetical protein